MFKYIKEEIELPFEVDRTYTTKFQTKEKFLVKEIILNKGERVIGFKGIYEKSPHLGLCPLGADRLEPIKAFSGNLNLICANCGDIVD